MLTTDQLYAYKHLFQRPAREVIALTALGEADCLGDVGMIATINTGQNRLSSGIKWWGNDLPSIFLHAGKTGIHQYSCWNADNPRLPSLLEIRETNPKPQYGSPFCDALMFADEAMAGTLADITNGATHYYSTDIPKPSWARGREPTFTLGKHVYYRITD